MPSSLVERPFPTGWQISLLKERSRTDYPPHVPGDTRPHAQILNASHPAYPAYPAYPPYPPYPPYPRSGARRGLSLHALLSALLSALLTGLLTGLLAVLLTSALRADVLEIASGVSIALSATLHAQPCRTTTEPCAEGSGSDGPFKRVDNGGLATPPVCDVACAYLRARIQRTYHDARTQDLLLLLAQTPTGRQALAYLLTMADQLGEDFITWQDLSKDSTAGENNVGGYIQLNSAALTRRDAGPLFLAGTLVHETVESYFDIGEGLRQMGTRHADYVAQWINGRFERELHALPYYAALDPFYLPSENSAYGLSYAAWLKTEDGQLYLGSPESVDLRQVDRRGRAWPASDWWAEQGGWWLLGQGQTVTPVPNPLGLAPALLASSDLTALAP